MLQALFFSGLFLSMNANNLDIELNKQIQYLMLHDGEDENKSEQIGNEKKLCISLGFNCLSAWHLRKNQLRKWAFPFDWNITSLQGLCELIDNRFADFLNPNCLSKQLGVPGVINSKYNMAFVHDFPEDGHGGVVDNYLGALEKIQNKYLSRIKRFYSACDAAEMVYFFRQEFTYWPLYSDSQNKKNIIRLRDVLAKKFLSNNWILVIIGNDKKYLSDWQIPQVKSFYISDQETDDEWKAIFTNLELIG